MRKQKSISRIWRPDPLCCFSELSLTAAALKSGVNVCVGVCVCEDRTPGCQANSIFLSLSLCDRSNVDERFIQAHFDHVSADPLVAFTLGQIKTEEDDDEEEEVLNSSLCHWSFLILSVARGQVFIKTRLLAYFFSSRSTLCHELQSSPSRSWGLLWVQIGRAHV